MKKILVIEDNEIILENTVEILELANYKTLSARNGKLGIELALKERPDLIICDIMMPVLDGYGVLHMIQKNPTISQTPFIFLTAKSERADFRKGMELGADDYITKPFDSTELLNAVEGRLKKLAAFRENEDIDNGKPADNDQSIQVLHIINDFVAGRNQNRYKRRQMIYSAGNRPVYLYYVLKGKIKTYKTNDEGKDFVMDLCGSGDFLGYVALLEGNNYQESAEALDDCELAIIPKSDFEELICQNKQAAKKFMELLSGQITEKENKLIALAYDSLRKRVADALVSVSRKFGKDCSGKEAIDISRENLASIAGVAKESFIRTLSDFKNEKLIEIKEGIIFLLERKKLETMRN